MGLMSKLDAVNEMLFNAGEQLVTSLTDDLNTDVNLAVFIVDLLKFILLVQVQLDTLLDLFLIRLRVEFNYLRFQKI